MNMRNFFKIMESLKGVHHLCVKMTGIKFAISLDIENTSVTLGQTDKNKKIQCWLTMQCDIPPHAETEKIGCNHINKAS